MKVVSTGRYTTAVVLIVLVLRIGTAVDISIYDGTTAHIFLSVGRGDFSCTGGSARLGVEQAVLDLVCVGVGECSLIGHARKARITKALPVPSTALQMVDSVVSWVSCVLCHLLS